ncbi:MAG TPA: phosphoglycerate dehydrogenase [Anaerolineales bacterium]|nr:phosphoglycerate dehydrogenase [Anaerolineales bacterium]
MKTVLITAPYLLPHLDRFRPVLEGNGLQLITPPVAERLEEADLLEYAGRFDGTICGDDRYTARVLEACSPRLRVISKWGTGIDSIDREACERLGIRLCNTPNAFSEPVADSVMAYILAFARRSPWLDRAMKRGEWQKLPGRALRECTLGVIGVGNCGKAVLRRAAAFGMTMLGNDVVPIDPAFTAKHGVEMTALDDLLARSDFISVNCDLNPTSYHIINAESLAKMKSSAVLVNTARGPLVDEPALVTALQSGRLAGAALDVFETEPLPQDSPLLAMDNVLLAPHNANSSPEAWEHVHRSTIRNLVEGLGI